MKRLIASNLFLMIMCGFIHYFFYMKWLECGIIFFMCVVTVLYCFRLNAGYQVSKDLFYMKMNYLEQLLCSYKKHGILVVAAQDCQYVFEENEELTLMLNYVIERLQAGEGRQAFIELERKLMINREKVVHDFLCEMEDLGGDVANSIDLMLKDIHNTRNQVYLRQATKEKVVKEHSGFVFVAIIICVLSRMMIPQMVMEQLVTSVYYEISIVGVAIGLLVSTVLVYRKCRKDWEVHYQKKNNNLQRKNEFTYWIMKLTLYLQHMTTYQAISQIKDNVRWMKSGVDKLLHELYEEPTSIKPYLSFVKQIGLPEMQTDMRLLYALQQNGYQEMEKQIMSLVEHNNLVMFQVEEELQKKELLPLQFMKQIPLALAGMKLLMDMAIYVLWVVENYSVFL